MESVGGEGECFVFFGVGVEIHKFALTNSELSHLLRNKLIGEGNIAFHIAAIRRSVDFILRVKSIKFFWESDRGRFDVFDITATTHLKGLGAGGKGFLLIRSDGVGNGKFAHSAGEPGGARRGQRHNVDRGSITLDA